MDTFKELIVDAVASRASDVHLCAGTMPAARVDGDLVPLREYKCTPEDVQAVADEIMNEQQAKTLSEEGEVDFAFSIFGTGRFRINIFHQRGTLAIAARVLNPPFRRRRIWAYRTRSCPCAIKSGVLCW